jgi:nucleotide-binding universal stress UspA family protein
MAGEIVVGYEGQQGSVAALRTATEMAKAFGRPLVIVFGYRPAAIGGDVTDLSRAVRELGERFGAEALAAVHAQDPSVVATVELVDDRPAEALLRAGDEHDALAIVVGTPARGPLAGSLLGSVTYQVVHRAERPVVVVPVPDASG